MRLSNVRPLWQFAVIAAGVVAAGVFGDPLTCLVVAALMTLLLAAVFFERRRVEEQLRASQQRFRTLAEYSHIGFWHVNPDGETLHINPALCAMLEVPDARSLAGETFHSFFTEESLTRVREEHVRRWRGEASTYEAELVGRHGGRRDVIVCGVPLMAPDGTVHSIIATFTDITQRKQAEETLRASQEMLRLVLDTIPQSVFWKDTHCVYMGCNQNAARIAGVAAPADIVGKTDHDLPSTDEEVAHFQSWDRCVMATDTPEYHIIEPLHLPDGTLGWLDTTKVPLHDAQGKVIGVLGVFEDITERKRIEVSLQASEQRFRALIEHSWDGISIISGEGRLIYNAPSVRRIVGRTGEGVPPVNVFEGVHPDEREATLHDLALVLAEPGRVLQRECRIRTEDGRYLWIECVACNLLHEPSVAGIVCNFRDVSERKQAEEEVLRRQAREKELVEEELSRVRNQLVRTTRLTALGQMGASIAHELRNPLGAIRNAVYLLRRRGSTDPARWSEYLEIIDQEIGASDRIISNLLEVSRATEPMREPVDVGDMVRDVFRRLHPAEGVTWSVTVSPDPFVLFADKVQLRQVLDNLVKNALDAAGPRGVISVAACHEADYASVIVQDDGPGVPAAQQPSLFEPLFSTKIKGTGLGLYISRQIVQRHGGTLEYLDRPRGATFQVLLPTPEKSEIRNPKSETLQKPE